MNQVLINDEDWKLDLLARTATHTPTGLIIRFISALDGSGAMTVDLVNPERLSGIPDELLMNLPLEAWRVYARHVEHALACEWEEEMKQS
ncbi:MAG: hypothetical protein HQL84_17785 [Magnetococcales bacterium]|nr:hypothetical protein [Magnetococcales bacterium]MBF0151872.1 hypothetical protein [Magnetococcales bacterium]MBF0347050.1 hypothetical protein [Magnetococcales bacterium]MBF0632924.1 hypothetical protein [Magnetococcales bacterium]